MRVILLMTAIAHHRQLRLVFNFVFMTRMAIDAVVFTVERKIRLRVMVKLPCQPVVGAMTQLAFLSQPLFVGVILLMASSAFNFGILV